MLFSSLAASLSSAVEEIVAVELQIGNPARACPGKQWKNIMRYFFLSFGTCFVYLFAYVNSEGFSQTYVWCCVNYRVASAL